MIFTLPKGSFVYFILFFIRSFPFSPVSRSYNTDQALPISKPDRQDYFLDYINFPVNIAIHLYGYLYGIIGQCFR